MTTPPPGWQPDRQPGPFPPHHGQPPGFDPQPPPPPGWQQGPWQQPPQKGSSIKWLLIAVAVLLVIAISVGGTLLFTRDGGGGGATTSASSPPASDIASAGDTGPVGIITHEPTCKPFYGINDALVDVQQNGWGGQHANLGPASSWTTEQRKQIEAVGTATRNAADQFVALARETPHRVVRELYEQFIAYGRAYADSFVDYVPADNAFADVNVSILNAIRGLCNAIEFQSANRALAMPPGEPPSKIASVGDPADPERFAPANASTCPSWDQIEQAYRAGIVEWERVDSASVPATQWTPEQRAAHQAVLPVMTTFASGMESTGRQSGDPVFEDFALLAAAYVRAYVAAGDNYDNADSWLLYTALRMTNSLSSACKVATG